MDMYNLDYINAKQGRLAFLLNSLLIFCLTISTQDLILAQEYESIPGEYVLSIKTSNENLQASTLFNHDQNIQTDILASQLNSGEISAESIGTAILVKNSNSKSRLFNSNYSDVDGCKELLAKLPSSNFDCSPNYILKHTALPNDPNYGSLWGLADTPGGTNAPQGWDVSTGSDDVVVAVIDTGVDYNHPDLAHNMWRNTAEVAGNGVDDDGNGVIDDIYGYNANANNGNPLDDNGHGSHCAGTIGGRGNNSTGVAGVNWRVKIMALKFLSASGSGSLSSAIQAINYMVMMKKRGVNIRVSNNSWGGGGFSQPLFNAIKAANDEGILFVAAAGNAANNNDTTASYPASYDIPNVVSVAAIDSAGNLASFSNYGATSVDIGAPGVSIFSTYKNGQYTALSGTSMATPHVAGALGLLLSSEPNLTNAQLVNRIYDSGVDMATLQGLVATGRKLHIGRMMLNITSPVPPPPAEPETCDYSVSEIVYNPDLSADNAAVIQQSDEMSFEMVNLSFTFPFHRKNIGSVIVSPNGLIYTASAPNSMDYRNGSKAPLNSIAPLWTDLKADSNPHGVRYAGTSEKAVFSWLSKAYGQENVGDIKVRLVLYADGIIDAFYEATNSGLATYIGNNSTVGITGHKEGSSTTFAFNNSTKIHNNLAVRFTPQCGEDNEQQLGISALQLRGIKGAKFQSRIDKKTGLMALLARGTANTTDAVNFVVNGIECTRFGNESVVVPLDNNGSFARSFAIGKSLSKFVTKIVAYVDGNKTINSNIKAGSIKNRKSLRGRFTTRAISRSSMAQRICATLK